MAFAHFRGGDEQHIVATQQTLRDTCLADLVITLAAGCQHSRAAGRLAEEC